MLKRARVLLNTSGADGFSPPVEFRLFRAGVNDTSKGQFIFDEAAAASVMSAYASHGKRIMLDLEHLSLDQESRAFDPNPRAWTSLEIRDGELWAVNTEWLEDGRRRLQEKLQPYVSPTFDTDNEGRVTRIVNIAMTALPATHQPYALVAASGRRTSGETLSMSPENIQSAIDAIEASDAAKALEILKSLIVEAAGGESKPEEEEAPPPDPALAEINAVTETESPAAALSVIKSWKLSHEAAQQSAKAIETAERKTLAGKLVSLGAETPATAYVERDGKRELCTRLSAEPIDSLRARVTALSASKKPANERPAGGPVTFSERDIAGAKRLNISPAEFVARKNAQVRSR